MGFQSQHTVHIPVMGTGFTFDTPLKVAKYGLSSVMSIGDDELCENIREYYCKKYGEDFVAIKKKEEQYRPRRITAYLNAVDRWIQQDFQKLVQESFETGRDINKYFELLPDTSSLKIRYHHMLKSSGHERDRLQAELRADMRPGTADVNIMTKIDRNNFGRDGLPLADEDSDALSALRGFANSTLRSGIVFSAGFNRRLYAYVAEFDDFFPDENGEIKKNIILKVSDFRSSQIQGLFFAKKGLWVSEHRIESGLNCGGHAFATDGLLLGPILAEFAEHRDTLAQTLMKTCNEALVKKGRPFFKTQPNLLVTVQGGIGTANEQNFMLDHYKVDRTGWATPFLLVPEVTSVDDPTREQLRQATKDELFLSDVSPLGVPFNALRHSFSEIQKLERAKKEEPGSPCPKGHLVSNTEFTTKPICTASRVYQRLKIEQLKKLALSPTVFKDLYASVVAKACLCEDLAAGSLLEKSIDNGRPLASAVCPGPNLAYFSKIATLSEMMGHIYGRLNLLNDTYRPNLFISELKMYVDYLAKEIKKSLPAPTDKQIKYLLSFRDNLLSGIEYYKGLIPQLVRESHKYKESMREELLQLREELNALIASHHVHFSPFLQTQPTSAEPNAGVCTV